MLAQHKTAKQQNKVIRRYALIFGLISLFIATSLSTLIAVFIWNNDKLKIQADKSLNQSICINSAIDIELEGLIEKQYPHYPIINLETENYSSNIDCEIKVFRNPKQQKLSDFINGKLTKANENIYVVTVKKNSSINDIASSDLQKIINDQALGSFTVQWDQETDSYLATKYDKGIGQTVYSKTEIENNTKSDNDYITIKLINNLMPYEKVLSLDEQTPFDTDFVALNYDLTDSYWVGAEKTKDEQFIKKLIAKEVNTNNFESEKLTDVTLTGSSSFLVPAQASSEVILALNATDILHVSNKYPLGESTSSQLNSLGVDVIGVTGDHILDFGSQEFIRTLNAYTENNAKYTGGGLNYEDAHTPRIIEIGGMKIAFLGYNFVPPKEYLATAQTPGNASVTAEIMKEDISKAKNEADFIIVDMEWGLDNTVEVVDHQREFGRLAIDYGADIVNGVHSQVIQPAEYYKEGIIFYGLGQFVSSNIADEKSREGMVIKHIFYDKKYLGFFFVPTYINESFETKLADGDRKDTMVSDFYKNLQFNFE